jgi:hypothetical protein
MFHLSYWIVIIIPLVKLSPVFNTLTFLMAHDRDCVDNIVYNSLIVNHLFCQPFVAGIGEMSTSDRKLSPVFNANTVIAHARDCVDTTVIF